LIQKIKELAKKCPNKKVGLVCFDSDLTIFGDGSKSPLKIEEIEDGNFLVETGKNFYKLMMKSKIKKSASLLI